MPELPEVETVRRSLRVQLTGRRLARIEVSGAKLRRPLQGKLAAALLGREVTGVERRGKYLVARLDDGNAWVIHLGMTGTITIAAPGSGANGHAHLRARLDDGRELVFADPRRFGLLFVGRIDDLPELGSLGVDPLSSGYCAEYLYRRCRSSGRRIKDLLMDQRIVAGLGNIYASEILFAAGLRPTRRAHRVTRSDAERLVRATRMVLFRALRAGGTSISDFRRVDGSPGRFQLQLLVYGREGCGCWGCGGSIRRRRIGGRSSFYCSHCQR